MNIYAIPFFAFSSYYDKLFAKKNKQGKSQKFMI